MEKKRKNLEVIHDESEELALEEVPEESDEEPSEEELAVLEEELEEDEEDVLAQDPDFMDALLDDPVCRYLYEIGQIALLTLEEERELGQKILPEVVYWIDVLEERWIKRNTEIPQALHERFAHLRADAISINEEDARFAREQLTKANLRLVVSVAKKYIGRGLDFLDLCQEGNIGLMRATGKYIVYKGYKFSTYAIWSIRHAMTRAIAEQSRIIRIPVHIHDEIAKMRKVYYGLINELGREPTIDEIAQRLQLSPERIEDMKLWGRKVGSLDTPIVSERTEQEDLDPLAEFMADRDALTPEEIVVRNSTKEALPYIRSKLTERQYEVLVLRFGLKDGQQRSLEETGKVFGVTRERVRQIQANAMKKLCSPAHRRVLQNYL